MSVGQNIRKAREEKQMTQDELAKRMGYKSRSTIARIENGDNDVSQSKLKKFSEILDVSISFLLDGDDPTNPASESDEPSPTLSERDERDIQVRLQNILDDMTKGDNAALYNGGEPMDPETRELMKASLENALRISKLTAKKKFTPKKYKDKK